MTDLTFGKTEMYGYQTMDWANLVLRPRAWLIFENLPKETQDAFLELKASMGATTMSRVLGNVVLSDVKHALTFNDVIWKAIEMWTDPEVQKHWK